MDGRSHSPRRIFFSAILVVAGTLLLLAAALARPAHSASAAKAGGTLRVNLSTTDVQYTDPSLEYEGTGWKETKAQLFPEAATSFPLVSAGGKRYTFHIRPGQRLSNGEKVTARNFQYAFQRAANPRMNSPAAAFLSDLASVRTVGKLTLVISLKRTRPDFASIVSMPFFQAISLKTPLDPSGVKTPPSGGPYYISARDVGRSIVLSRNRFYKGKRPHNPNLISISVNTNIDTSLLQVQSNARDYDMFGVPPTAHVNLHNRYPKQYHVKPGVITDFLTMNTTYGSAGEGIKGHSCFNGNAGLGPRTRRAVNYAVNRPNVAKARSLKPKHCNIVMYAATSPTSIAIAQLVKNDLSNIGMNTTIRTFPFAVRIAKEGHRGEPYDLDLQAWGADYPDPVDFIDILLDGRNIQAENNNDNSYFNHAAFNNRMRDAGRISNLSKRYAAWAAIDRDVMKQQAPLAPLFFRTVREFTSKRVGCYSYQPIYAVMNFNAVCLK